MGAQTSSETAAVTLRGAAGSVYGRGVLVTEGSGVRLQARFQGLSPGPHGLHVHACGDLDRGCDAAGAHYNPHGRSHGGPDHSPRHPGDFGNVLADANGDARLDLLVPRTRLGALVGRSLVLHRGADDLGRGAPRAESLKTGNSGARLACGVIAWTGC